MRRNDAEIIAHAAKWRHWGGASHEDIFVEFGMSAVRYYLLLRRALTRSSTHSLDSETVDHLLEIADRHTRHSALCAG